MLIVCPNCATSYSLESSSLGSAGRSVRCARCRTVWFAVDTSSLAAIAYAHRADMSAFATDMPAAGDELLSELKADPALADHAPADAADAPVPGLADTASTLDKSATAANGAGPSAPLPPEETAE